jgi:erythromycin esterase
MRPRLAEAVFFTAFLTLPTASCSFSQPEGASTEERIDWLREHVFPVRSIDPSDTDFSDLEPIAAALKGVRVLLLGEQTHADGATFDAKARLVKFLHQDAGFGVLAFEANQEIVRIADEALDEGEDVPSIADLLPRTWGETEPVRGLVRYAREVSQSPHPLRFRGFDVQINSLRSQVPQRYQQILKDRISRVAPTLQGGSEIGQVDSALALLGSVNWDSIPRDDYEEISARVRDFELRVSEVTADDTTMDAATLQRFLANIGLGIRFQENMVYGPMYPWTAIRDSAMAENLAWLARRAHPETRIVAWGHSGHFAKSLTAISDPDGEFLYDEREVPMGEHMVRLMGDQVYSVGFLAFEGEQGQILPDTVALNEIPAPPEGSLDWLLGQLGQPYLFLDLRSVPEGHWLREELIARPSYREWVAIWPDVLDGVFFTREMYPINRIPNGS